MLTLKGKLQLLVAGLLCSVVAGIAAYWIAELPVVKPLEIELYKMFLRASHAPPFEKFLIIDVQESGAKRGRGEYAEMIRQLRQAGAKCIALDIIFAGINKYDPAGDRDLVETVAQHPEVVLAINFVDNDKEPGILARTRAEELALKDSLSIDHFSPPNNIGVDKGLELPFDSLLFKAHNLGHINSFFESHHFPPILTYKKYKKTYASLPVQLARLYFVPQATKSDSCRDRNALKKPFHLTDIRLDKDGQMLVNFIAVEQFKPFQYGWNDVITLLKEKPERLCGAVVIIANPSEETLIPDTPVGPYPRWALLASLANQLLLHRYIEASAFVDPLLSSMMLILLGLTWLLFLAPRLNIDKKWRRFRFILGVGNLLCLILIFFSLLGRQWLGVVAPLLGFNASLVLVRTLYYRRTKPAEYVDFELSVAEGENGFYSIQVIKSPVGEEEDKVSLQAFWEQKKFQEVSQRLNALEAASEDLIWAGDKLFAALFPNAIFNVLRRSLDVVKRERNNLRLKLRLDAPELMYLPWELTHNKKLPGGFLALLPQVSLTRYLPLEQPLRKPQFRVPMRILVLISSRADLPLLDVEAEKETMEKALNPLTSSGDVQLKIREHVTRSILFDELENDPPDVLHYIGHSSFAPKKKSGFLELESEDDEPGRMSAEELGGRLLEKPVKLVVLNSCQGATAAKKNAFAGIAQNLVRAGVPAVVAMQYPIRDTSALMFSDVFYSTLIKRYSIDDAVATTRRTLAGKLGSGQQDWATPVLFMRASEGKIFEVESS